LSETSIKNHFKKGGLKAAFLFVCKVLKRPKNILYALKNDNGLKLVSENIFLQIIPEKFYV
jgi:hypothetical protein